MKNKKLNKVAEIYSNRFNNKKLSKIKIIGWGSKKSQKLRFEVLTSGLDLNNKTVLDFGCGFGDLYSFIQEKNNNKLKKYVGIDICKEFILYNNKKYRKINNVNFLNFDLNEIKHNHYDYCFMSGTLNLKIGNNYKELISKLKMMYKMSKIACGINLLSTNVDYKNPKDFHYNPSKVIGIAQKISPKFIIRHDYPLYEFTLHLFKKFEIR